MKTSINQSEQEFKSEFYSSNFVTRPYDKIVLLHTPNQISDSLTIEYIRKGDFSIILDINNNIGSWIFLKEFNEIGSRSVTQKNTRTNEVQLFENTLGYIHRFCK